MALSLDPSPPHFRAPSYVLPFRSSSPPDFQAPVGDLFQGDWFMVRSSNAYWKDKRNVRLNYAPASSGSYIADQSIYQTMNSDAVKVKNGWDTPCEGEVGAYVWQGKGFLRVASARWEVLCFASRPGIGDWMLIFQDKSIFTSPAISLLCRNKAGPTDADLQQIDGWLQGVEDEKFQEVVRGMANIKQE